MQNILRFILVYYINTYNTYFIQNLVSTQVYIQRAWVGGVVKIEKGDNKWEGFMVGSENSDQRSLFFV